MTVLEERMERSVLARESLFDRDSSLFVARGLYVLRYESGGGQLDHPTAVVRPGAGSEADIEIISPPGCASGRLDEPGAAVLVRAADHGQLQIGVKRRGASGSLDAAFKLESVGSLSAVSKQGADSKRPRAMDEPAPAPPTAPAPSPGAAPGALFIAHVARRGDIWVTPGEWAGGPDTPGGIEGLELRPLAEKSVQVELQATAGRDAWSNWSGAGVFVGSRGQNRSLAGLRLRLAGDGAHRFFINADALFLGSAIMNRRGRDIECVSHAGRDPLVGFRFEVCPERRLAVRPPLVSSTPGPRPRVRVFRAGPAPA